MRHCDNCGTQLDGCGRCPNCHEELIIFDQYVELDMETPSEESEFMKKYHDAEKDFIRQNKN